MIATSQLTAIVGAGVTGVSVARFLARQGQSFVLFDTRTDLPGAEAIRREFGSQSLQLGELSTESLLSVNEVVVSPGVPLSIPALVSAKDAGVPVIGDIELFRRHAQAPIVAITGSNAKSTVTSLVGAMARRAGLKVAVGGNLGTPALDLLDQSCELYVLELSSFQLESVSRLDASVACILNVSPDHLDRYPNLQAYHAAKLRVYFGASQLVINRGDVLTHPPLGAGVKPISFGRGTEFNHFGVTEHEGQAWLAWQFEPLLPVSKLKMKGTHNRDNALAALAIGHAAGLAMTAMLEALQEFPGLSHRCEWVGSAKGVDFFNDSKATNVGATLAAINGLSGDYDQLILIAGGEAKGSDFQPLREPVKRQVRLLILMGRDADQLASAVSDSVETLRAESMAEAVALAGQSARSGEAVLLSPACASFDMFNHYEDRGAQFRAAVEEWVR